MDEGQPLTLNGGCLPAWRSTNKRGGTKRLGEDCPAWKVFKHYYTVKVKLRLQYIVETTCYLLHLQKGKQFSSKTDQLLASSFSIPMAAHTSMKKTLLSAIHRVEGTFKSCHHRAHDTKVDLTVHFCFQLVPVSNFLCIVCSSELLSVKDSSE